jgi:dCTP deaminase
MVINGKQLLSEQPILNMEDRKYHQHGVSHGLSEVGYDIRLKQTVRFNPGYSMPDLPHRAERLLTSPGWMIKDGDGSVTCGEGRFVLASALEEFDMPTHLMGIVHDKSTWARHGLSVFNTVIEPGWKGFLTLELVYHGNHPLEIPAGAGIAQVVFHHVTEPAQYKGKYQHQANQPVQPILVSEPA